MNAHTHTIYEPYALTYEPTLIYIYIYIYTHTHIDVI